MAYFTEGRPVKGSTAINYDFDDARYLFSSQKNRERFAASPIAIRRSTAGCAPPGWRSA